MVFCFQGLRLSHLTMFCLVAHARMHSQTMHVFVYVKHAKDKFLSINEILLNIVIKLEPRGFYHE